MIRPKVKICCISSSDEAKMAIRYGASVPLFLAGGLNKDNVKQAIERVEPFGVDLCSGVRTNGKLDEQKLKDFFNAIEN